MVVKKNTALLLSLILPAAAAAETYYVPGDYPNIQSAMNAASDGDTVLVGPGQWAGPVSILGKDVVLKSSGGPTVTDIHTFSDFSVVYFTNGEGPGAILEGFTITHDLPDEGPPLDQDPQGG